MDSLHKFDFEISKGNFWQSEIPNYHRGFMDASDDLLPSFTFFFAACNLGERSRDLEKGERDIRHLDEKKSQERLGIGAVF